MARNFLHEPFFYLEWQAFHSTVKVADFIARIDVKIRFVKRSQVCVLMKQRICWILCDSGNLNIFVSFIKDDTHTIEVQDSPMTYCMSASTEALRRAQVFQNSNSKISFTPQKSNVL